MQKTFLFLAALLLSFSGFAQKPLTIILSQDYGPAYKPWLLRHQPDAKLISLYHVRRDSIAYWLNQADGFLLTGGEDVYPARYGQEKDTVDCGEFDKWRDTLEYRLLDAAFKRKKPLFGICRGEQITNIYLGGSLVVDIPTTLGNKVAHRVDGPTDHDVEVIKGSSLDKISKVKAGSIKSNHHQGINRLGNGLVPMAKSADGLIEAVEMKDPAKIPFLMAVQWHPERMADNDPLSFPLGKAFVDACRKGK